MIPTLFSFKVVYCFLCFFVDRDENSSLPVCESRNIWAACIYDISQFASSTCMQIETGESLIFVGESSISWSYLLFLTLLAD